MTNYLPPPLTSFSDTLAKYYPEEHEKDRKVREITFQVTEDCCMACTYCYQHKKTEKKMSFNKIKPFLNKLFNDKFDLINTSNSFAVIFDFIGGEPFMNVDLIDQIANYSLELMINQNHEWLKHFRLSFSSNGFLYDTEKVQNFFKKYDSFISMSMSIDGNKELHDKCRLDLEGKGTYDRVLNNVLSFKNKYGQPPDVKMTLAPENIQYTFAALKNLIEIGYTKIPFNCIFEKGWEIEHAQILYEELKKVADYLIENDFYNKINIRMFQEDGFQPIPEENDQNWCGGTDTQSISIDCDGNLFPCVRYMISSLNNRQRQLNLGNIEHGYLQTEEEKENYNLITDITRRSQSTDECFYCPIGQGCAWCSAYNYEEFGTPNKRATYICVMHKAEALANVYYWNKLYKYLNIDKIFEMYCPKEWALEIISENEYNYLLSLINK